MNTLANRSFGWIRRVATVSFGVLAILTITSSASAWPGDHQGHVGLAERIHRIDPPFYYERGDFGFGVLGVVKPSFGYGYSGAYCPRNFGVPPGNPYYSTFPAAPFNGVGQMGYGKGGFYTCPY